MVQIGNRTPSKATQELNGRVSKVLALVDKALGDLDENEGGTFVRNSYQLQIYHLGLTLLEDLFGADHRIPRQFEHNTRVNSRVYEYERAQGILQAVQTMVSDEWLTSTRALIAGAVFSDYLDMAEHLSEETYKDAAAVIAGSSLEAHMRRLALKHGVPLTYADPKRGDQPKKLEVLNADLVRAEAYDKDEQKQVSAWLGTRNAAAHGHYEKVNAEVVKLMIHGVRSFLARYPA
jgi:hypothetical protein